MSFYIQYHAENTGHFDSKTWHVPSDKPKNVDLDRNIFLQADGNELEMIHQMFKNVPTCYRICKWRGQMASFIFENL